jgi:hypothetical protein
MVVGARLFGVIPQAEIIGFGIKADALHAAGLRSTHKELGIGPIAPTGVPDQSKPGGEPQTKTNCLKSCEP